MIKVYGYTGQYRSMTVQVCVETGLTGVVAADVSQHSVVEHLDLSHNTHLAGGLIRQGLGGQQGDGAVGHRDVEGLGGVTHLDADGAHGQTVVGDELVRHRLVVAGEGHVRVRRVARYPVRGGEHKDDVVGLADVGRAVLIARAHVRLRHLLHAQAPLESAAGIGRIRGPELNVVKLLNVKPKVGYIYKNMVVHGKVEDQPLTCRT